MEGEIGMRIVVAPDSFKGSASASEVADALARGLSRALPNGEFIKVPMADGGEGTVHALVAATNGRLAEEEVCGPLGRKVRAFYGITGDGTTAVIEMAAASGLTLVRREERDPRRATSFGTGELIRAALDQGCRRFIIGIGGSATNDGGAGLIQALGGRLLDKEGKELPLGGAYLAHLERIDLTALDPRLKESRFLIACDVDNPLLGERGASAVYGPQKGATPQMVKELDRALARYAEVIKRDLDKDVANVPGSGAAGGLGAGLMAFLDATLHRGVDLVIEAVGLADKVKSADLVITGEGSVDGQTVYGKTPVGVARVAKSFNKPVVAVAGTIGAGAEAVYGHGVDVVVGILEGPTSLDTAMARAVYYLETTGERLGRLLKVGAGLGCALPRG